MEENKTNRTIKPLIFLSETPNEKQFDTRFEEIYANSGIDDAEMTIMSGRGELTKDFYEALRNEGDHGTTVYTNDLSQEYLKQIATSTRFMVETNLEILKQQERSINLLRSLLKDQKK